MTLPGSNMLDLEVSGWVEKAQVEAWHMWIQIHPACAFGWYNSEPICALVYKELQSKS